MTSYELIDYLAEHIEIKWKFLEVRYNNGVIWKYIRTQDKYEYDIGSIVPSDKGRAKIKINLCPLTAAHFIKTEEVHPVYSTKWVSKELDLSVYEKSDLIQAADDNLCSMESVKLRNYMIKKLVNRDVCDNTLNGWQ